VSKEPASARHAQVLGPRPVHRSQGVHMLTEVDYRRTPLCVPGAATGDRSCSIRLRLRRAGIFSLRRFDCMMTSSYCFFSLEWCYADPTMRFFLTRLRPASPHRLGRETGRGSFPGGTTWHCFCCLFRFESEHRRAARSRTDPRFLAHRANCRTDFFSREKRIFIECLTLLYLRAAEGGS